MYSAAHSDTGWYSDWRAHNPKVRGSTRGPWRTGENPPFQRVGKIVGKAAKPVHKYTLTCEFMSRTSPLTSTKGVVSGAPVRVQGMPFGPRETWSECVSNRSVIGRDRGLIGRDRTRHLRRAAFVSLRTVFIGLRTDSETGRFRCVML